MKLTPIRSGALILLSTAWLLIGCQEEGPAPQLSSEEATVTAQFPSPGASPTQLPAMTSPYLQVLGTAQDGGLPHAACSCERCEAARNDPARKRLIASLGLVFPASQKVFLIDATPDIREQIDRLADIRKPPQDRVDRAPVDGVLLTHAHIGHYLGLAFFGFEAVHTRDLPVWATPRMIAFLEQNGPWSQLIEFGNLRPIPLPEEGFELAFKGEKVRIEGLPVPHRDEFSDTVAFRLIGPQRTVLYVPDTDAWTAWNPSLTETLEDVDVALLDGTFFSLDELPGRSIEEVKHPLITASMDLLEERVQAGTLEVYFTHINHSNPCLDPDSGAHQQLEQRGFALLQDGQQLPL